MLVNDLEEQEAIIVKLDQYSGWGGLYGTPLLDEGVVGCLVEDWDPLLGL